MDKIHLPNITLTIIDCKDLSKAIFAVNYSSRFFKFGKVKILTSIASTYDDNFIQIPHIYNRDRYSYFCVKELYKYIDTEFCLIIQSDGFVVGDASTWNDEFLQYDYIGAPWGFEDGLNVGNGGFSLRSKRILEEVDKIAKEYHPEDVVFCRICRKELEDQGIKYAPVELAAKFSIERNYKYQESEGRFGFHGFDLYDGKPSYPGMTKTVHDEAIKIQKQELLLD